MTDLLLASKSPRRRELLAQIGVQCQTIEVTVEERRAEAEEIADYVKRLAREKACAGWQQQLNFHRSTLPVLGSDTVVVVDRQLLEKPVDQADAQRMLKLLSGRAHKVLTAVAVCGEISTGKVESQVLLSTRAVFFRPLSAVDIERYWHTGEPLDKAGAYGIQGLGAIFIERIEGSYSGVMGLPLFETEQLLSSFSVPCWQ